MLFSFLRNAVLCAGFSFAASISSAQTASGPLIDIPNATDIRIWEVTGTPSAELLPLFDPSDQRLYIRLSPPLNGSNKDFTGLVSGQEHYDAYISTPIGNLTPSGNCLSIRGTASASAPGFNIARVDIMAGATILTSFDQVTSLGIAAGYLPGSEGFIVDNDPGLNTWSNLGGGSSMDVTLCRSAPNLTIQKNRLAPADLAFPGDTVRFEILVDVDGAGLAAGQQITMTDTYPIGLNFVSAAGGPNWACTAAGGTLTCTFTAPANGAPSGGIDPMFVDFTVAATQTPSILSNCATLTAATDVATVPLTPSCADVQIANRAVWYAYSIKYLCGWHFAPDITENVRHVVADGRYRTEINIVNTFDDVQLRKSIIPLVNKGKDIIREPQQIDKQGTENFTLRAQHATLDDCTKLGEMYGRNDFATGRINIGFLTIFASAPIDVTAVYTAQPFQGSADEVQPALDVESIEGKRRVFILQ